MKILLKNLLNLGNTRIYLCQKANYVTELFPYTTELYRKNYIKYPVQSKLAIVHDYKFTGQERLPTFDERIKGDFLQINKLPV